MSSVTLSNYVNPSQEIPFGSTSQWAQPWRAYLTTVPASTFLNGTSLNYDYGQGANPDLVMEQLATHGVHRVRLEIGWGSFSYNDESTLTNPSALLATLAACKKWGIRPLILLNANSMVPTPELNTSRTVTSSAAAGATTLTLNDASGLTVGFSGVSNLNNALAAGNLITAINGNTVTLSKPLPSAITAGTSLTIATLKYRPFSAPGTADYAATLAGWLTYVTNVGNVVSAAMGTQSGASRGYDLEVWNELTFGSEFLSLNNYYTTPQFSSDPGTIRAGILAATAALVAANPGEFAGVSVGDGFANTLPWAASSTEPPGVDAVDKHVYPGPISYPTSSTAGNLDALGNPDSSGWQPNYTAYFPEYNDSALQTEFIGRDLAPINDNVYGTVHGENAGTSANSVWITETNLMPNYLDPSMSLATDEYLKAKVALRYDAFYLNKGASLVDLYDATSGGSSFGELSDSFVALAKTPGATYPADDSSVTSPEMQAVGNLANVLSNGIDPTLTTTRPITLNSVVDQQGNYQFLGDGTAQHPTLYDSDVFTFLPYQVNASTFAIPYYVMTRNVDQVYNASATGGHQYDLPTENFALNIGGIAGAGATVTAYDPINNVSVPVNVTGGSATSLQVTVGATDYPYVLEIHEGSAGAAATFTNGPNATFTAGAAGAFRVTTSGTPAAAITETGALPAGLGFLDNGDGTASIVGTPAANATGIYSIVLNASNANGTAATQSLTLNVDLAPAVASGTGDQFQLGSAGGFRVTTVGFPAAALSESGALPAGVTFVDNGDGTATLAGTPTQAGDYRLVLSATNSAGAATQSFDLDVTSAPAFTSGAGAPFALGATGHFRVTTVGFPAAALSESGTLPAGVTFVDDGDGTATLAGTPTQTGDFQFVLSAISSAGGATQSFDLDVPTVGTITSPAGVTFVAGQAATFQVVASGDPSAAFVETGALPAGVGFDPSSGLFSGTPAAGSGGDYPLQLIDRDSGGSRPQTFDLRVNQAPTVAASAASLVTAGSAFSMTICSSGFPLPQLHEVGALPAGLAFVDNGDGTATLSGTVAVGDAGAFNLTFRATNGLGSRALAASVLTVTPVPLVAVAGPGGTIVVSRPDGTVVETFQAMAASAATPSIASATMDGRSVLVVGMGAGGAPRVKIFDEVTGATLADFLAFGKAFRGGVYVGAGDVSGDGAADLVVAKGAGGRPRVRVFDGQSLRPIDGFLAYNATFRGGVRVAVANLSGDGHADIITASGPGAVAQVEVFDGASAARGAAADIWRVQPFAAGFTGGAFVAAGGVTSAVAHDIVISSDAGMASRVKVYDFDTARVVQSFQPMGATFNGGLRVGLVDAGDGGSNLILAGGDGASGVDIVSGKYDTTLLAFSDAAESGNLFVA